MDNGYTIKWYSHYLFSPVFQNHKNIIMNENFITSGYRHITIETLKKVQIATPCYTWFLYCPICKQFFSANPADYNKYHVSFDNELPFEHCDVDMMLVRKRQKAFGRV